MQEMYGRTIYHQSAYDMRLPVELDAVATCFTVIYLFNIHTSVRERAILREHLPSILGCQATAYWGAADLWGKITA